MKIRINKSDLFFYSIWSMILIVLISGMALVNYSGHVSTALSNKVIRFHVVANSDTAEDQLLKQQVKDEIIAYMEPLLKESHSIDDTRACIKSNLPQIQMKAEEVIARWNKTYSVYVALDSAEFPTKAYGDVVLPAGEYEACRVIIGGGKGENWWCVMFPPLCYVDAVSGVVPLEGKEQLEEALTEEQYKMVLGDDKPYQIRFKIVDTINALFHKSNYKEVNINTDQINEE